IAVAVMVLQLHRSEQESVDRTMLNVAESLSGDIDRDLERRITILHTLATSPSLARGDWERFYEQARAAVEGEQALISLVDRSMNQVVNTLVPYGAPILPSGIQDVMKRVLDTGEQSITNRFIGVMSRGPVVNINVPVKIDGEVRYVLAMGMNPSVLGKVLEGERLDQQWTTTLVDGKGVVITSHGAAKQEDGALSPVVGRLPHDERTVAELSDRDERVAAVRSRLSGWMVLAKLPRSVIDAPLRWHLLLLASFSAAMLVLVLALGSVAARRISAALATAAEAAQQLAVGNRVESSRSGLIETDELLASFARTAETIHEINTRLQTANDALAAQADELRASSRHKENLILELNHRVKNILSVIIAVASRTLAGADAAAKFRDILVARLHALARTHDLLTQSEWQGVSLPALLKAELEPFSGRYSIDGPDLILSAKGAQNFGMAVHELATNASKYGALSNDRGTVRIEWRIVMSDGERRLVFDWREAGGPPVEAPRRQGFGTVLLTRTFNAMGREAATIDFAPEGFQLRLNLALASVTLDASAGPQAAAPFDLGEAAEAVASRHSRDGALGKASADERRHLVKAAEERP